MLSIAVGLFAVGAVGGLTLATLHFRKKNLPLPLALLHGLLGAAGLVVLLVAILQGGTPAKAAYALILFAVAAVGGFYLFSFHLRKKSLPSAIVVIHALVAVIAFALLVIATFLGHPVHVPLTHFPLALWTAGFGGDLVYLWKGDVFWWNFAFWSIALGLGLGCLTLLTGFYDYIFIPEKKPSAFKTATFHMLVMLAAACLFAASLFFHRGEAPVGSLHQILALALSGMGTLFLHCGGWLGGQLVYHFGVGSKDP